MTTNVDPTARTEFIAACVAEACRLFLVNPEEVLGKGRTKCVAAARALAMALARRRSRLSFPEIGRAFGRDHTTVMAACKRAEREFGDRLNWEPAVPEPGTPTSELTLEQWNDRLGWPGEVATE